MAENQPQEGSSPRKRPGTSPGTLIYTGTRSAGAAEIHHLDYSAKHFDEGPLTTMSDCFPLFETGSVTWVDVKGLSDVEAIRQVSEHVGLHRLAAEDIVSTSQRPKVEPYPDVLYVVLRMLSTNVDTMEVENEQVSLVLGSNFVLSFQEHEGDVFDPVRERLRNNRGVIRERGADYLAYALMDAVVDHYFLVVETLGDSLDVLEIQVLEDATQSTVREMHQLKRELISVRRAVWPLREVIASLYRDSSPLIQEETRLFLRDVHDHTVQVADTIESLRDVVSGLMDLHLSSVSNRMNEVMKVLTIMSTIFIPLSFLAGLYGMNFDNMPELHTPWGYPVLLSVMVISVFGMLWFFRRKGWL